LTEIELKAHVTDPDETERHIRAFAAFRSETVKKDCYWTAGGGEHESDTVAEHASARMVVTAAATVAGTMAVAVVAAGLTIAGAGKIVIIGLCLGTAFLSAVAAVVTAMRSTPSRPVPPQKTGRTYTDRPFKIRIREESSGDPVSPAVETVVTYKRKEFAGNVEVNDEKEFAIDNRSDFEVLLGDLGFAPAITKEKRTKTFDWTTPDGTAVGIELSFVGPLGWFIEIEILADSPDDAEIMRARNLVGTALARCGIPESAIETRFYTEMLAAAGAGFTTVLRCQFPKK